MDGLRWILLGTGVLVVLGIYLAARLRQGNRPRDLLDDAKDLESLQDVELRADGREERISLEGLREELAGLNAQLGSDTPARAPSVAEPTVSPPPPAPPVTPPELLIVVHIGAPQGERFDGAAVLEALQGEGLVFGAMDIFHRMAEDGGEETLFSVANAVKPGTLVPHELPGLSTPGLSLFLRLPAPGEPMAVFEDLMSCAQGLADRLGGQLQDETRSAMTAQTEAHLRERVGEWGAKYG